MSDASVPDSTTDHPWPTADAENSEEPATAVDTPGRSASVAQETLTSTAPPAESQGLQPKTSRPPPNALYDGRYLLGERLPWGTGDARYFSATKAGEEVALMVLPKASAAADTAESLQLLAHHLAAINDPTLLPVARAGVASGRVFFEHAPFSGEVLTTRLGRPIPSLTLLRIADQVLRALIALHQRDLVHGRLTPDNILVAIDEDPERPEVRLLGSGLTPVLEEAGIWSRHGKPRGAFGVEYCAPEVAAGDRRGKRSDFYAVGVLLQHMCTGQPSTGEHSLAEGFHDIPQLPDVIRRATAEDPADRYSDGAAMLAALDWLEVVSSKMNPHTQDIPLWMENSVVGSIPVAHLNAHSATLSSEPAGVMPGAELFDSLLPGARSSSTPRQLSSPRPASPLPVPIATLSAPEIPLAAAVPRATRGVSEQAMWWLAAVLAIAIILIGLGLAFVHTRRAQQENNTPAEPTTAPSGLRY